MKEKIAGLSVFVNLLLAIGKVIAGVASSSASVLAEGIHSGMDVLSSGIGYIGITLSKKPVDNEHPYGHHKFEVLSGAIITLILFATGLWIIHEAYQAFLEPAKLAIGYLALGVMVISAIVNDVMARLKLHYGKEENSISLVSDGVHSRIDVWTSLAVLLGLLLSNFWVHADALLALLIGLYIIKESFSLGKEATYSLLDVSAGEEIEKDIKELASQKDIIVSDIKTQKKGSVITANLEIELPGKISLDKATKISNELKEALIKNIKLLEYVAIQIKSHDVTDSYFKPKDLVSQMTYQRGFGWHKIGKFHERPFEAPGKGSEGSCICPECGYKAKHEKGIPCSTLKCPKCRIALARL